MDLFSGYPANASGGREDPRQFVSPSRLFLLTDTVYLLLSLYLLFYFLLMTFQTPLVQIPQGSYLFVLVTTTPFRVYFVLGQLMGSQPAWNKHPLGLFSSLTKKATGVN